jgi:hypothetical protein
MNNEEASFLLPLHRPGRPSEGRLLKAVRRAEKDPELCAQLSGQIEFDERIVEVIRSIQPPDDLHQKLRAAAAKCDSQKRTVASHAFHPAVLTAILGVLLIVGFFVWTALERMEKFAGREAVERMLATTSKMSGVELDAIATQTGTMGDWFYMRGFEGFSVPREMAGLPTVGSRVFRQDGHPIAQVAVDRHESILYVFRASDFGIELPADEPWRLIEFEGWAAALQRHGDICSMLAFRGEKADMRQFLASLKTP